MYLKTKLIFIILILSNLNIFSMQYNKNNQYFLIEKLPNEILLEILEYTIYQDIDITKNIDALLNNFKKILKNIKNIALVNKNFNRIKNEAIKIFKLKFFNNLNQEQIEKLLLLFVKYKSLNKFTENIIDSYNNFTNKIYIYKKFLIDASNYGNLEIIEYLLQNIDINIKDRNGDTILIWASYNGYLELVKILLKKTINLNAKNKYGYTALIKASYKGNLEIVKSLLEKGANLNIANNYNYTALIWAVIGGKIEIVKTLVENGANLSIKNKYGQTALDTAKNLYRLDIIEYLKNINNNPI